MIICLFIYSRERCRDTVDIFFKHVICSRMFSNTFSNRPLVNLIMYGALALRQIYMKNKIVIGE